MILIGQFKNLLCCDWYECFVHNNGLYNCKMLKPQLAFEGHMHLGLSNKQQVIVRQWTGQEWIVIFRSSTECRKRHKNIRLTLRFFIRSNFIVIPSSFPLTSDLLEVTLCWWVSVVCLDGLLAGACLKRKDIFPNPNISL